jgi:hypothetical protein
MENTETKTQTQTEKWEGNFNDIKLNSDDKVVKMDTPVFIIFAEFLGYVSKFNKIANDWCDGKIPDEYIQKIMNAEARCILHQMMKDYTIPTMRYWFKTYYPVVLEEIEEKLARALTV